MPPFFPRLRRLTAGALASLALVSSTPVFACGPFFPATILDHGERALLTPLGRGFAVSLSRLPPAPASFPYVPISSSEAERADLAAAGADEAMLTAHALFRTGLDELARSRREESSRGGTAGRAQAPVPIPHGAPPEFALYLEGARAWLGGDADAARAAFARLLELPPERRKFKSTWAAFSLGQVAAAAGDVSEAARRFVETRALAAAGFADSAGLATASLGQEARLHFQRRDWLPACALYLRQHANGDPSALHSLLFTLSGALHDEDPAVLPAFARSAELRSLLTARLLASTVYDEDYPGERSDHSHVSRWLRSLEEVGAKDAAEAELFALLAYRFGALDETRRWLALAPAASAPARWLRAKLALRDGRVDEALALLSSLVREPSEAFAGLRADSLDGYANHADRPAEASLRGELGALRLARRDYLEAARLLLEGGYWSDAAYVAERVLTVDELRTFVDATPETAPGLESLRLLLARRLVREERVAESRAYFTPELQTRLDLHLALLRAGADSRRAPLDRGRDLAAAARILRHDGFELRGTELAPDYVVWDGDFTVAPGLEHRQRPESAVAASADEVGRALASAPRPDTRFHHRPLAAALAWQAAALYPDNHDELAALLAEAGGWLKARDPRAADRFYKELVRRCPDTALGRAAAAKRWFP